MYWNWIWYYDLVDEGEIITRNVYTLVYLDGNINNCNSNEEEKMFVRKDGKNGLYI